MIIMAIIDASMQYKTLEDDRTMIKYIHEFNSRNQRARP
jgi:hypothetical protein